MLSRSDKQKNQSLAIKPLLSQLTVFYQSINQSINFYSGLSGNRHCKDHQEVTGTRESPGKEKQNRRSSMLFEYSEQ